MPSYNWNEQELEILKQMLAKGKTYDEIALVINRSRNSIALKAQRMYRAKYGKKVEQKQWTKEEIEYLTKAIDSFHTPKNIAKHLNRSVNSVVLKASKLGLKFKGEKRIVSKEEFKKFKEDWCNSKIPMKKLAKKYHRTEVALHIYAHRKGLGPRNNGLEMLTISDIVECTGLSNDNVRFWLKKGLKYKEINVGKSKYYIDIDDLIEFLKDHQDLYDATKIDTCIFPTEIPKWFKEKYHKDSQNYPKNSHIEYTDAEDRLILKWYKSGMSKKEIAKNLKRTETAIKSRLQVLSEGKMSPIYYTDEEIRIIKENAVDILPRLKSWDSLLICGTLENHIRTSRGTTSATWHHFEGGICLCYSHGF